jgi:hypothetical protein
MKKGKNSPERLLEEIVKLDSIQFLGICKILGVKVYKKNVQSESTDEGAEVKNFNEMWEEVCDIIGSMNRTRRRNLGRLIYAATKGKEED